MQECSEPRSDSEHCYEPESGWPHQLVVEWQVVRGLLQLLRATDDRGVSNCINCAIPSASAAKFISAILKTGSPQVHAALRSQPSWSKLEQANGLAQLIDALLYFPCASFHAADALFWVSSGPLGATHDLEVPRANMLVVASLKVF